MSIFKSVHTVINDAIEAAGKDGTLTLNNAATPAFVVEPPRDPNHGDLATNAAMMLSKLAGKPPRVIAEILKPRLEKHPAVASVEIAGPGFINLRLVSGIWQDEIKEILRAGIAYGESTIGDKRKVNIEYVSANPTGPMHAGHVRGAVVGDALAHLMQKAGYDVSREYYINDAGSQVDTLARTAHLRYRQALGEDIGAIPEGYYPGDYMKDVAAALIARDGNKWLGKEESEWLLPLREFCTICMMDMIKEDLAIIGVKHAVFTSELSLIKSGAVDKAYKALDDKGLIYVGELPPPKGKVMDDWEPVPLTLFRSSNFGDTTDRPVKKRDGSWTYAMPDIAYHYNKLQRGFTTLIDVLGVDHASYADRIRYAVKALGGDHVDFNVVFGGIVKVLKNGEPVKLSKRSGNIITLREMVEQVGAGAVRFFMLTRESRSELEFDFAKVVEQTRDNPVFYVQYAHARCFSILRHAAEIFSAAELTAESLAKVDLSAITSPEELLVVKGLANWSRVVEAAALACEPHRIAFYLMDLAALFHGLWNKGNDNAALRFIIADDKNLTRARMALIKSIQIVIQSGLAVMGCQPIDELRHDEKSAA